MHVYLMREWAYLVKVIIEGCRLNSVGFISKSYQKS